MSQAECIRFLPRPVPLPVFPTLVTVSPPIEVNKLGTGVNLINSFFFAVLFFVIGTKVALFSLIQTNATVLQSQYVPYVLQKRFPRIADLTLFLGVLSLVYVLISP